ncbi:nitrogen fixation protein NifZ [Halochromatium glycolicum]|uniref:Nitrogen fixation protein NifZ n=1 Tax=Halochromatium glycolicum TaxID=85075 RepID=A0AAJ0U2E5_9GAMM|nr:nitrogen fixation protein NifZ [Halochromatium glycolicum]
MRPRFDYGDEVRLLRNVRNDGTYPGEPTGALLIRRGRTGFVRDVGTFLQDQIIYTVHFLDDDRLVGCRDEELQPAADPWTPSRFETRDKVAARLALGRGGRVLVEQGRVGDVVRVLRSPAETEPFGEVAYQVQFPGCSLLQVPESALDPAPAPAQAPAQAPATPTVSDPATAATTTTPDTTNPDAINPDAINPEQTEQSL